MRVLLILVLWTASAVGIATQNQSATESLALRPPDNCEGNSLRLDVVRNKSLAAGEKKVTIAIARLGNGEQSRELNRRRLYTIRAYLTAMELPPQRLITAEGERVLGYGRIELYVGGELVEILSVEQRKDLWVGICDDDVTDKRRYQLPRRGVANPCR